MMAAMVMLIEMKHALTVKVGHDVPEQAFRVRFANVAYCSSSSSNTLAS
jgi:hypothetical protein